MRTEYRRRRKKWYHKKRNWLIFIIIIFIGIGINSLNNPSNRRIKEAENQKVSLKKSTKSHTNSEQKKKDSNKTYGTNSKTKKNQKNKKINKFIASHLEQNKGFSKGTLDENGNPSDKGIPNPEFNWSTYVVKIILSENNQVTVHTTTEFTGTSIPEKNNIALKSQNVALLGMAEYQKVPQKTYQEGLSTLIYQDDTYIGRSTFTYNKQFKWNKE